MLGAAVGAAAALAATSRLILDPAATVNIVLTGLVGLAGGYVGARIQANATHLAGERQIAQQAAAEQRAERRQWIGSLDLHSRRVLGQYDRLRQAVANRLPLLAEQIFLRLTAGQADLDTVAHQHTDDADLKAAADSFLTLDAEMYERIAFAFSNNRPSEAVKAVDTHLDGLAARGRTLNATIAAWVLRNQNEGGSDA